MQPLQDFNYKDSKENKEYDRGFVGQVIDFIQEFGVIIIFFGLCVISFWNFDAEPKGTESREFMALRSINLWLIFIAYRIWWPKKN
jgi:hypothetical protein